MWFLVKATFWFSLVLVLLPFLDPSSSEKLEHGPKMEIGGHSLPRTKPSNI